jgi:hypothetical protein
MKNLTSYSTADIFSYCIKTEIDLKKLFFVLSKYPCPYLEVDFNCLNLFTESDLLDRNINVNLLHRFDYICDALNNEDFGNNRHESGVLEKLVDLIVHFYASIDLNTGINVRNTIEELVFDAARCEYFGKKIQSSIKILWTEDEKAALSFCGFIADHLLYGYDENNLYNSFKLLFKNGTIYLRKNRTKELILFFNEDPGIFADAKINLIETFFIPFDFFTTHCYSNHFGVIGEEKTMKIDHILIID